MKGILAGIVAIFFMILLVGGCTASSTYNSLIGQEKGVSASWSNSQIVYDNFWKKVQEVAQVPESYKDAFKDVLLAPTEARYAGKDPAFLMITEANPQLDPSMYVKVQQVIEAGRNEFAQSQTTLRDRQRAYETNLSTFPNNLLAGVFGFPHEVNGELRPAKDLDGDGKYTVLDYPIVTSDRTQQVFTTGRDNEALDVFGKKAKAVEPAPAAPVEQ